MQTPSIWASNDFPESQQSGFEGFELIGTLSEGTEGFLGPLAILYHRMYLLKMIVFL